MTIEPVLRYAENALPILSVDDNYPNSSPFGVVWHYFNKLKVVCCLAIVLASVFALLEFGKFWFIGVVVDLLSGVNVFNAKGAFTYLTIFITLFGIVSPVIYLLHTIIVQQIISPTTRALVQRSLHKNISDQEISQFANRSSGQVTMRLHTSANAVRTGLNLITDQIPTGLIQFVGTAVFVAAITPIMALPVVIWILANIILVAWLIPRYSDSVKGIVSSSSHLSGQLTDLYNNIFTVKLYDQRPWMDPQVSNGIANVAFAHKKLGRYNTALGFAIQFLNAWLLISVLLIGYLAALSRQISPGEFAAAVALVLRLASSVDWFVGVGQAVVESYGALDDSAAVFSRVDTPIRSPFLEPSSSAIQMRDVWFSYPGKPPLLRGLSLTAMKGEKIGIIGESGSGKSTLIALLAGLIRPVEGSVHIHGVDTATLSGDAIRHEIAVVTQDTALLNRSVGDNIRYGLGERRALKIDLALKSARAEFVHDLQDTQGRTGLESEAGEKGMALSGGQRQRVIIARALMRNTGVLILDEATSALDPENEKALIRDLVEQNPDMIIISITHRASTLRDFDRVYRLCDGTLLEHVN